MREKRRRNYSTFPGQELRRATGLLKAKWERGKRAKRRSEPESKTLRLHSCERFWNKGLLSKLAPHRTADFWTIHPTVNEPRIPVVKLPVWMLRTSVRRFRLLRIVVSESQFVCLCLWWRPMRLANAISRHVVFFTLSRMNIHRLRNDVCLARLLFTEFYRSARAVADFGRDRPALLTHRLA